MCATAVRGKLFLSVIDFANRMKKKKTLKTSEDHTLFAILPKSNSKSIPAHSYRSSSPYHRSRSMFSEMDGIDVGSTKIEWSDLPRIYSCTQ
ncbi:hypothetical protein CDAR_203591 [Caerostris darwini]|uniref:Uncharacterized protein n=1 Tax=Caerostris darwini TaxID=1538125 RepID=A0AAV4TU41_9ARAC|nr:hypothetical protein CDAR_203591 [Caerostris darwini]